MSKECSALAIFFLVSWGPAYGQYASVVQMCTNDITKYCSTGKQLKGRSFADCITGHFDSFSGLCKTALLQVAAVSNSCSDDISRQCPLTRLGSSKILSCMKRHYSGLSEECKASISFVAANQLQIR